MLYRQHIIPVWRCGLPADWLRFTKIWRLAPHSIPRHSQMLGVAGPLQSRTRATKPALYVSTVPKGYTVYYYILVFKVILVNKRPSYGMERVLARVS